MGLEGYRGELGLDYVKAWMLTGGFLTSPEAEAYMREQLNSDSADDSLGAADGYPTTEGVTLRLREPGAEEEGDVWVTAPGPQGSEESSRLVVIDGTLVVETPDRARAEATFVLPALCNQTKLNDGTPFKDVMAVHGRRGRFSLVAGEGEDGNPNLLGGGCALDCQMCPLARSKLGYGGIKPLDRLIEAGKIALGEQVHPADHFLISGGGAPQERLCQIHGQLCSAGRDVFRQSAGRFDGRTAAGLLRFCKARESRHNWCGAQCRAPPRLRNRQTKRTLLGRRVLPRRD